jgi:hypothetical protein
MNNSRVYLTTPAGNFSVLQFTGSKAAFDDDWLGAAGGTHF